MKILQKENVDNKITTLSKNKSERANNKKEGEVRDQWTQEEKEEALNLLKQPDLLNRFQQDMNQVYAYREKEKILLKLAFTGRKVLNNTKGTGVVVRGPSSVGKSALVDVVLATCEEGDKKVFTRITPQYLLYTQESFARKILVIYELPGAEDASLSIRTGLSESTLKVGTVDKNRSGGLGVRENEIDATGIVFVTTTIRPEIDFELGTRVIIIELEHDPDIAGEVYKLMSNSVNQESEIADLRIWKVADSVLTPRNVKVLFAEKLAKVFPRNKERYLRDFARVLHLIQASALLHQHQRPIENGSVIATEEDYKIVYELQDIIFPDICDPKLEDFIKAVKAFKNDSRQWPTRKQVERYLQTSLATVKRRVKNAMELGVISVSKHGDEGVIKVIAELNILSPLSAPGEIFIQ